MTVRTRADLDELPSYVAGRSVAGSVKLASNEVSAGPLPTVVEAITATSSQVHRYPDMSATELLDALSRFLRVDESWLAVGCGSVALCQQLVQATCTPDDEVLFPWRSFEAYPVITRIAGAKPVTVALNERHALDLDALLAAITPATRLVFVCTPNNPTGTLLGREELDRFLDSVPNDVLVVLDEAYWEFVTRADAPNGIETALGRENVVSLRTFSKAYGLAGLRVGYAVAPPKIADALHKVAIPFSVNKLAQAAAVASLEANEELKTRCEQVAAERSRVRESLLECGYTVPETQANFVWLALGENTEAFNQHCLDNGVVVRAFAGDGARVTIGDRTENDLFLRTAAAFAA